MRRAARILLLALLVTSSARAADYVAIPGARFRSALALDQTAARVDIEPFRMRARLVTVGEYLAFLRRQPEWRRNRVPALLAQPGYLASWAGPLDPGSGIPLDRPVTQVSWFAARAYCASENARLPDWYEWEYVAAADARRRDARGDALRNAAILATVQAATGDYPQRVGLRPANAYGVFDANRLVWEWTGDYAAMFPDADTRAPGGGAGLRLCGGSALAFADREQYALVMRVAALTALKPMAGAPRVGFRCVRDGHGR